MTTHNDTDRADALMERLFAATIDTLELYSIHLGTRLGLYRTLADGRPRAAPELSADAGIAERYAREWLEQQAVAGLLEVENAGDDAGARRYHLAADHARVLADPEDPVHVAPFATMIAGIGQALPQLIDAYRTGGGVAYDDFGEDFRDGQAGINRPAFTHDLTGSWLPAVPDLYERLTSQPGVRVADVGCGTGWSTIALARAFPEAHIDGVDADRASIVDARANLAASGVASEHVRFLDADVADLAAHGPFDLVIILEALHDFGRPGDALRAMHDALAPDGTVVIADERVAERFTAPGDEVERMMYGWSVTTCLPASLADTDPEPTGTALRADTLRDLAYGAGFIRMDVLPIDNDLFRFYRLWR